MKVFIIHAHPEPKSFCSALKDTAAEYFTRQGHDVTVSDLYAMSFRPVGGREDFTTTLDADYFKYQAEQMHANRQNAFAPLIRAEMDKLEAADVVIFSFPLWWFSMPAILKGWVDRVFAMGKVYGEGKGVYENGIYPEKKAFLTVTTGGPAKAYEEGGRNGELQQILFPIHHGILYFVGMQVLPPFVSFGPVRLSEEERQQELDRYRQYLNRLDELHPLF